ncbi:MAG: AbrB/MazE/SpoVT family DNA-binding domain-containing protein [Legionella sp.]|nr:AbrB/MazE/SpoVT family DNA-binding domain-containing protein [Legionella sp.]
MPTVTLKKWGNSVGVRIPVSVLKEAHLEPGESLDISINEQGALVLNPTQDKQTGWTEQFNAIADADDEAAITHISNEFDEDDWTW